MVIVKTLISRPFNLLPEYPATYHAGWQKLKKIVEKLLKKKKKNGGNMTDFPIKSTLFKLQAMSSKVIFSSLW